MNYSSSMLPLILSIAIQALLVVHCIKTGRNQIWIWVLILLPVAGPVAYVAVEVPGRRAEQGAEGAFLVEREHWGQFMALLKEEQRRLPDLKFEHTGPWPAYDFVRLDLNG